MTSNYYFFWIITISLGNTLFGVAITYYNIAIILVEQVIKPPINIFLWRGIIIALIPFAASIGSMVSGYLLRLFNCKRILKLSDLMIILGSLI